MSEQAERVELGFILRPSSFGLSIPPDELPDYNRRCIEALSDDFTSLWMEDHLQWGADDNLENLTTMSFLAGAYPRFRVGNLVLSHSFRNPALLAKMAANLQFISGGRCILGLGAGWKDDEYRAYGYPVPDTESRWEQFEEALAVIRAMWERQPASFAGKHHQITDAYCVPAPSPAIPLMIGGGGEARTLPLVARYADWWNYNSCPPEAYARKLEALKRACERIGRDPATIRLTYSGSISVSDVPGEVVPNSRRYTISGNAEQALAELDAFRALGVTHFMVRFMTFENLTYFVEHVAPYVTQPRTGTARLTSDSH